MEFDAQPPMMTPYTSSEETAKTNRIATFTSARTQRSLNGITAQATMASTKDSIGARKKTNLSAPAGTTISLSTYFRKSAKLWSRPKAPTTFGPRRI